MHRLQEMVHQAGRESLQPRLLGSARQATESKGILTDEGPMHITGNFMQICEGKVK
jgi:hypothetical protein